ncbi:MAG: hypothetical protein R3B53_04850 [Candidatus Paceibacterota bacterium]
MTQLTYFVVEGIYGRCKSLTIDQVNKEISLCRPGQLLLSNKVKDPNNLVRKMKDEERILLPFDNSILRVISKNDYEGMEDWELFYGTYSKQQRFRVPNPKWEHVRVISDGACDTIILSQKEVFPGSFTPIATTVS